MIIEVDIARLVLDGVNMDPGHTELFRAGLVAELSRRLSDHHEWQPRRSRLLNAPPISVAATALPAVVGEAVAGSLHTSVTSPASSRTR
jgi:hypothetical protein